MEKGFNTKQAATQIVAWLSGQLRESGCRGLVFGLSGGLDSAVLAALCRQASPDGCHAVIMPCHSSPRDREMALLVAEKPGIMPAEVDLGPTFDALMKALPSYAGDEHTVRKAGANVKARLRMLTLYNIANQLGCLVAGSSNRSEVAVGYFTKYGDGGVDIMPLGGLVKTRVRELAKHLAVPQPVIDRPPSAGLWEGQTDEAEMGFTYSELDGFLLWGHAEAALKAKIEALAAASVHKQCLPPIAPLT